MCVLPLMPNLVEPGNPSIMMTFYGNLRDLTSSIIVTFWLRDNEYRRKQGVVLPKRHHCIPRIWAIGSAASKYAKDSKYVLYQASLHVNDLGLGTISLFSLIRFPSFPKTLGCLLNITFILHKYLHSLNEIIEQRFGNPRPSSTL